MFIQLIRNAIGCLKYTSFLAPKKLVKANLNSQTFPDDFNRDFWTH